MSKSKVFTITVLLVFLVAMLAGCEQIKKTVKLPEPGVQPEEIKGEGVAIQFYNKHRVTIDFFIMFALFCAIAMLGLKKFGAEGAPGKGVAVALALALALAAMKAGFSPSFFIPFVKNALFLIIFFMIFMIVRSTMGGDSWIGPFLIALAITFIAFNVGNIILDPDKKFDLATLWSVPTTSKVEELKVDLIKVESELDALGTKYGVPRTGAFETKAEKIQDSINTQLANLASETDEKKREEARKALLSDLDKLMSIRKDYGKARSKYETIIEGIKPPQPAVKILEGDPVPPGEPLTCVATVTIEGKDIQPGEVQYDYFWYKNGAKTQYTDRILPRGITAANEKWECQATPRISGIKGPTGKSAETRIVEGALVDRPQPFSVSIRALTPTEVAIGESVELTVIAAGGKEPYTFKWIQDPNYPRADVVEQNDNQIKLLAKEPGNVVIKVEATDVSLPEPYVVVSRSFIITVREPGAAMSKAADALEETTITGDPDRLDAELSMLGKEIEMLKMKADALQGIK